MVSCETAYSDITECNNSDQEVESGDDASNVNAGTVSVADSDEVSEGFDYFVDADDGALNGNDDAVSVIDSGGISVFLVRWIILMRSSITMKMTKQKSTRSTKLITS